MYCSKCGEQIDVGDKFCSKCGNSVADEVVSVLTVVRPKSLALAIYSFKLRIDKSKVYSIKNGETVTIPIESGEHLIEVGKNEEMFLSSCYIKTPQEHSLTISINKLTGAISLLKAGEKVSPTTIDGMTFSDMKSKLSDTASNIAASAVKASNPVILDVPEGGVEEPDGYDTLGAHIEIATMPAGNALDAINSNIMIIVDDLYPYTFKDGQKLNIPVSIGNHRVKFITRDMKGEVEFEVSDITYLKIVVAVSLKIAVTRNIEICDKKENLDGLYVESIIAETWDITPIKTIKDFGITKCNFIFVTENVLVKVSADGDKEQYQFIGQYRLDKVENKKFKFLGLDNQSVIVEMPLTEEIQMYINSRIAELNQLDDNYIKMKADEEEKKRREATFNKSFGYDEKIEISEELGKGRLVCKDPRRNKQFNLSEIVSYKAHEIMPQQQDTLTSAIAGNMIAGRSGAYLAASHARDVNNSINSFEVWITRNHNGDVVIDKVKFGASKFEKRSDRHQMYITEYKRFETYMNSRKASKPVIIAQKQLITSVIAPAKEEPAEELRKYKSLLDDGIITQEDFDAKKKQLLGI